MISGRDPNSPNSSVSPSGLTWESVAPCVRWMTPFMDTLRSEPTPRLKDFPKVKSDDRHNIQTHVAYLDLLVSNTHAVLSEPGLHFVLLL